MRTLGPAQDPDGYAEQRYADRRLRLFVIAVAVAFFALLAGLRGFDLLDKREETLETAERHGANLALILSEHLNKTIAEADAALIQLAGLSERIGGPAAGQPEWGRLLETTRAGLPGLSSLSIVDADGVVTASTSAPAIGQSRRDFYLFRQLRDHPDLVKAADVPFRGLVSGRLVLPIGHRLLDKQGRFAGVVVAVFDPEPLREFYRSVDLGAAGSLWILHPNGTIFFNEPSPQDPIGQSVAQHAFFRDHLAAAEGGLRQGSLAGAADDITAFRLVRGLSLIVAVTLSREEILRSWRSDLINATVILGLVAIAIAVATGQLLRQLRLAAAANRRLQQSSNQLLLAEQVADAGSFRLDMATGQATLSPHMIRLLDWQADRRRVSPDTICMAFAEEDAAALRMALAHCTAAAPRFQLECRLPRGDSLRRCWIEGAWEPAGAAGAAGIHVVCQDVTDRRLSEESLYQAQKMEAVGQLTGGVAHDFNNLLTVIIGNVELLGDSATQLPPATRTVLQGIDKAASQAAELTRRLLAFARRQPLQPKRFDLGQLVQGMSHMLERVLGETVSLELVIHPMPCPAHADPAQVESSLLNLCINARDAMPRGGKLIVETGLAYLDADYVRDNPEVIEGAYVVMSVSDTGSGMSPEVQRRAFEPFFTTKGVGHGSGLGLSMVYGFAKQSRGHVKIYSEVDVGTTIRLYLPRADDTMAAVEDSPVPSAPGIGSILVVEDDPQVRAVATAMLTALGYRIAEAADPQAALSMLAAQSFDLLFTDVVLPGGMNGVALARQAQALQPKLRVLYTSGYTENAIIHHGRLDPGVKLLSKPYRRDDLARLVRQALA